MIPLSVPVRARLHTFLSLGFIALTLVFANGCSGISAGSSKTTTTNSALVKFTVSSLPSTAVGSAYSASLQVTGGVPPYSFAVISGALPLGLTLSNTTGVINGTPTSSGKSSFTVQVSDSSTPQQMAQGSFSIAVNPQNGVVITTTALPNGIVGTAYSSALAASGGTTPYSWTVTSGSLPAGLSLSSSGTISGIPSNLGQANFTVQVTDSSSPAQQASRQLSISISAAGSTTVTTASLPNGIVGTAYSSALTAAGGITPYSWTVTSGSLPAGLSLSSSGVISGTPTNAGQSNFTVQVTDSSSPAQQASKQLSISVNTALTITTTSLPNGIVGTAYSSALTASGGVTPYSWTVTSGSLPAGLSLSSSGTISGTPTSAGQSDFTVQVTDSSSPAQQASQALAITVVSKLRITGSITPNAAVGVFYSSTDQASGGTPAYTWSISSGSLPPGLTLAATTGTISGTPSQAGKYNFTLAVTDSGSPAQKATQADQITVGNGGQNVWSLQTTLVGWQFVSPTGAFTCKYNAISKVDDADLQSAGTDNLVLNKYGSWNNWALEQSNRLTSLGFTAAGLYSYRYQGSSYPQGGLPYAPAFGASLYVMRDSGLGGNAWHVKNAYWIPQPAQMKCGSSYGSSGFEADPFDPIAQTAYTAVEANFVSAVNMKDAIIVVPDEADYLYGIDYHNNHGDLGLLVASNSPMVKTSQGSLGGKYNYPDATEFAKTALRDYLLNEYLCTGPGQPVSTCTGAGTGTGSADPSSPNYVGAGNAANALAALNSAWSTSYTTWNTSDAGGLAGIANGSYASYATGTGFLDENGSHLVANGFNCSGTTGNGPAADDNWPAVPQIKTDVHLFVGAFAAQYASTLRTAWLDACGANCPPMAIPNYDGPMYTYAAMAPYTDLFWTAPAYYANPAAAAAEVQQVIDNAGGKPVIVADYFRANPDSWNHSSCDNGGGFGAGEDCSKTQAIRGATYVALRQAVLPLQNLNGKFAVVGLEHWSLYDSKGEGRDFGLFTPNDNGYDGSAASSATGSGSCATNQAYTQPAICLDSNNNYQGLAVASCTSGSSAPTWNPSFNGLTANDGSCTWLNEGPYPPFPESANWGDALLPIANFNTAGICDP